MDTLELTLTLVRALDDPPLKSLVYQAELLRFQDALAAGGVEASPTIQLLEAWTPEPISTTYLGDFTIKLVATIGPVIGAALGAFMQARWGRKVRLKIGDIEAEAQTLEQVEHLLNLAEDFRQRNKAKVVHEP
jgi:hypothetical protein